jgi:cell division protein ZapD
LNVILYEYPFNEKIRTYLRLEQLFSRLFKLMGRTDEMDHHFALTTLFEILNVGARADLKTDVLKDLEKQKQALNAFRDNPAIATDVLDEILGQLSACFAGLSGTLGKLGQVLTENDWLMSVRSRAGIPGGTCAFDLPAYHAWQQQAWEVRQQNLREWVETLLPLSQSIQVLLNLLRDSGSPQKMVAASGQFQQNLPQGKTAQMLRLSVDHNLGIIPEISGNRLLVSIRFMRHEDDNRLHASNEDSPFEMALCS